MPRPPRTSFSRDSRTSCFLTTRFLCRPAFGLSSPAPGSTGGSCPGHRRPRHQERAGAIPASAPVRRALSAVSDRCGRGCAHRAARCAARLPWFRVQGAGRAAATGGTATGSGLASIISGITSAVPASTTGSTHAGSSVGAGVSAAASTGISSQVGSGAAGSALTTGSAKISGSTTGVATVASTAPSGGATSTRLVRRRMTLVRTRRSTTVSRDSTLP